MKIFPGLLNKLINSFSLRTHTCGQLRSFDVGRTVSLAGWIQSSRMDKFVLLRDSYGLTQLVIPQSSSDLWSRLSTLPLESVIHIKGIVLSRPPSQINSNMETGEIEVQVEEVIESNPVRTRLPFLSFTDERVKVSDDSHLRLRYRHLDLRSSSTQSRLRFRSELVHKLRSFLDLNGFIEVETPCLFKRTPGGAREFIVPSSAFPGSFYSLVQSPQQFKQLLMVGGIDRYYQVARCFRDEGSRPDRQPEFTQVDLEMSFIDRDGIKSLIETMVVETWPFSNKNELRFPILTYRDCMERFGSDKPDLRIPEEIQDITDLFDREQTGFQFLDESLRTGEYRVKILAFRQTENKVSVSDLKTQIHDLIGDTHFNSDRDTFLISHFVVDDNGMINNSLLRKCDSKIRERVNDRLKLTENDYGIIVLSKNELALTGLGRLRSGIGKIEHALDENNEFRFLWVQDFPLFFPKEGLIGKDEYESAHHPFTQPHPDDLNLLDTDPLKVRSLHYDLVLNGCEVAGGSIRIHDSRLQHKIIKDILREDVQTLSHFITALDHGCPPHGGIAIGLDRYLSILLKTPSIRDVIAFPKSVGGRDLLSDSPSTISSQEMDYYHIKIK